MFEFIKKLSPNFLGIDIGTTGIRLVELRKDGKRHSLINYGHLESEDYLSLGGGVGNKRMIDNTYLSHDKIVKDLKEVITATGIDAKKVAMSIPISSAFSSVIGLPNIHEDEIDKAVNFEARKYIPIPLEEVSYGWSLVHSDASDDKKNTKKGMKVLLVAIPKEITVKYSNIIQALNLDLISLETESFPLSRSLADGQKGVFTIVDIGSKTTSITIVEDGVVFASHSVSNIGGLEITNILSHGFNIDPKRAEALKRDIGLKFSGADKKVSEIMMPIVSVIGSDIRKINETYTRDYQKAIDKIILTGGSASLPGIVDFFKKELQVGVEIGNPWKDITFDEKLTQKLTEIAPQFSIAVGLALRGFEK